MSATSYPSSPPVETSAGASTPGVEVDDTAGAPSDGRADLLAAPPSEARDHPDLDVYTAEPPC